jgi:hypothetical protein
MRSQDYVTRSLKNIYRTLASCGEGVLEAMTVRPSPRVATCHLMMPGC